MRRRTVVCGLLAIQLVLPALVAPAHADVGDGLASFRYGRFAEAYQAWAAAAATGDARAARYLGVMYDTGEGVRQDRGRAVGWYRLAADLGDPTAMFNVGVSYDSGNGIGRDHREAAHWYARAAARHYGRAEYDLALMYRTGDGVTLSPAEATRLFRAAARDGIQAASLYLPRPSPYQIRRPATPGTTSAASPGAPSGTSPGAPSGATNDDRAFLQAQRALLSRQPRETADAVGLFRKAGAASGPVAALALYDLGWCYENGVGVPADASRAYGMYVRAAAVTDDRSLRNLAEGAAAGLRAASPSSTQASR